MGHGKLKKFAENETFRCLLQPDASSVLAKPEGSRELVLRDHAIKGNWNRDMFEKPQPIVLELGCGKGDYTIALARRHPEMNFIGVDIKGARLWKGAKEATEEKMGNVAFLRTRIEFIDAFFGPGEVSQIWITFSDPQLRGSENARLTSPLFLQRYSHFLVPENTPSPSSGPIAWKCLLRVSTFTMPPLSFRATPEAESRNLFKIWMPSSKCKPSTRRCS